MAVYRNVGRELTLDEIIYGGNYIVGDEKSTKWPTLYGDMRPPEALSAYTIVRTQNRCLGEVGGNKSIIIASSMKSKVRVTLLAYRGYIFG